MSDEDVILLSFIFGYLSGYAVLAIMFLVKKSVENDVKDTIHEHFDNLRKKD